MVRRVDPEAGAPCATGPETGVGEGYGCLAGVAIVPEGKKRGPGPKARSKVMPGGASPPGGWLLAYFLAGCAGGAEHIGMAHAFSMNTDSCALVVLTFGQKLPLPQPAVIPWL